MKIGTVAILGAGVNGKVIASVLSKKYPELDILLFGEPPESLEDDNSSGLFYFDNMIPDIAETPIKITSTFLDDENETERHHNQKVEQFTDRDDVPQECMGYLLNDDIDLSNVTYYKEFVSSVELQQKRLVTQLSKKMLYYDFLISTIPLTHFYFICRKSAINGLLRSRYVYLDISKGIENFKTEDIDRLEVVYNLRDSSPYYRQSYYWDRNGHLLQVKEESLKKLKGINVIRLSPGRVITDDTSRKLVNDMEKENDSIKLLGMYARWDSRYLVQDSYNDSIKFIDEKIKTL